MADTGGSVDGEIAQQQEAAADAGSSRSPQLQARPKILLMGSYRSGKTSIVRVVFQGLPSHQSLYLESTTELSIKLIANNPYVQFEVWDFPCSPNLQDGVIFENQQLSPDLIFGNCAALIYVLDAQGDPATEAMKEMHSVISVAREINPNIRIEFFIHKVDGDLFLSEDLKLECQREFQEQIEMELEEDMDIDDMNLCYYLTSVYDHSIFEAFSKVVHKQIPQLAAMENLLNILIASCAIEKAFLFDVVAKIFIATDHNPVDIQSYELCTDMIDVVVDMSCIYGMKGTDPEPVSNEPARVEDGDEAQESGGVGGGEQSSETGGDPITETEALDDAAALAREGNHASSQSEDDEATQKGRTENLAFNDESYSLIRLNNNVVLYLRQVATNLALVCIIRTPNYEKHGLINYNVKCFAKSLAQLFSTDDTTAAEQPGSRAAPAASPQQQ
mmetsp:Transcript_24001/g.42322  ORF Transcript_24001/g.42322 Transcript_24001/m.42322 type:complete len:446 (-) Transcript_24001:47-1384(-)